MKTVVLVLALTLAAMIVYVGWSEKRSREARLNVESQIERLAESVERLTNLVERVLREREEMEIGELYAAWYSGNPPELIEVRTVQRAGETDAQTIARHDADVAAKRIESPPILGS